MNWIKRGSENSVEEYFLNRVGTPQEADKEETFEIPGTAEFVDFIRNNRDAEYVVIGDYDADGVTASAVMKIGLEQFFRLSGIKNTVTCRIPKRFSEGYGISDKVIDDIPEGCVVITVDNGISAIEEIKRLKEEGDTVLLTDHHLPVVIDGKTVLPGADVLIDPHVKDGGFKDYCGAGIAFKIMQTLLPENDPVLPLLNAYAAIGTIADIVPLVKENRTIVRRGLEVLNRRSGILTRGLKYLIAGLKFWDREIESDTVAFYIAPALTAVSRLSDTGAVKALELIIDNSEDTAKEKAGFLISENEKRKAVVEKAAKEALKAPELDGKEGTDFPVMIKTDALEGVIGLIASRLCEKFRGPAIVFTRNEYDKTKLTGSARSMENCHIKELLDRHREFFLRYGGHAGAAGCSINADSFDGLKAALRDDLREVKPVGKFYDLELEPEDAMEAYISMQRYKPFGEGNEEPVFHVKKRADRWMLMGSGDEHIKFIFKGMEAVMFHAADRFDTAHMEERPVIDVYGRLSLNDFRGVKTPQIKAEDIIVNKPS